MANAAMCWRCSRIPRSASISSPRIWPELNALSRQAREQLEIDAMYSGYLERQALDVEAFKRDEDLRI
jgi:tRNA U34 5-carboxymethylaminomethyl modifying enzyme MnmG/GidA